MNTMKTATYPPKPVSPGLAVSDGEPVCGLGDELGCGDVCVVVVEGGVAVGGVYSVISVIKYSSGFVNNNRVTSSLTLTSSG